MISLQPIPQIVLACREMLYGQCVNHICCHSSAVWIVIGITEEVALDRNVREEGLREMGKDWHEAVIFIHSWQRLGCQLWKPRLVRYVQASRGENRHTSKARSRLLLNACKTKLI
jgi:hypothetical protein